MTRKLLADITRRRFGQRSLTLAGGLALITRESNAQCTCTHTSRYYGLGTLNGSTNLIGLKATIKTVYNSICCESGGSTADAYEVAYVNIDKQGAGWAQGGWGKERNPGTTSVVTYRYSELEGSSYSTYQVNYDTSHGPAQDSSHTYQIDLDTLTGTWSFSQDGTVYHTFQDDGWKGSLPYCRGVYSGETYNTTDKMVGTSTDKCSFTGCQYNSGSGYTDAYLSIYTVEIDPSTAPVGASYVSATAMNIWSTV